MHVNASLLVIACLCALTNTGFAKEPKTRIWIDTDAACGAGFMKDVDDCLAIAVLLNHPDWEVVGISTVFGNASVRATDRTVRSLVDNWCDGCVPVFRGAKRPGHETTHAANALVTALAREPLVVFILGPATNISAALKAKSTLQHDHQFVAVAGTREQHSRFKVSKYSPFRLRDLNFASDPGAFKFLLSKHIDLSLAPFELAQQVTFQRRHIDVLARRFPKLASQSRRWLWVWRLFFGKNGFHPFDAVAVGLLDKEKGALVCSQGKATVVDQSKDRNLSRAYLYVVVGDMGAANSTVTYCHGITSGYADILLEQLTSSATPENRSR